VEAANTTIKDEEKYQSDIPDEHAPEVEKQNICDFYEGTPTISNGDADMCGVAAVEPQPDVPGRCHTSIIREPEDRRGETTDDASPTTECR
jgi:hypothetical protein